nr:hypothetical protein [Oscillospiraceae bacterium]
MSERELKKLRRGDLLEMMLALTQENEDLRAQLEEANRKLASRSIVIENAGSLAEAALQLNGIFEAAQAACDQYTQNIRYRSENIDQICSRMEQETREKCQRMLSEARLQAGINWEAVMEEELPLSEIEEDWLIRLPE